MDLAVPSAARAPVPASPVQRSRRLGGLPADLAFLRAYHDDEPALHAAAAEARRCGAAASTALLAGGSVSDTLYYGSLARHLDVPFLLDWPPLGGDPAAALLRGGTRLASGGWLLAPTGRALRLLLDARRLGLPLRPGFAITTPAHFAALVARRLPVARLAGSGLADAAPMLSARDALGGIRGASLALAAAAGLAGLLCGSRALVDALGVIFFAAQAARLCISAAGWSAAPADAAGARLAEAHLPTYSVLVPLRDEAAMVPSLVAALDGLDYPRVKLDVLFLVEADDAATRLALLAARLPPHMRAVTVPAGNPRTKPRALNVGLMLARGALVTVYDAEDHPAPNQLRLAAAGFAAAGPDLACLQARLVVSNGADGLLQRLFAVEYAGLFDNLQPGAVRLGLPIALGGTSNHFRGIR